MTEQELETAAEEKSLEVLMDRLVTSRSRERLTQLELNVANKQLDVQRDMVQTFAKRIKVLDDIILEQHNYIQRHDWPMTGRDLADK